MRCLPEDCEHCLPWGPGVPGKTRCTKGAKPIDPDSPYSAEREGWRFSTTLGGPCVIEREMERGEQQSLWE